MMGLVNVLSICLAAGAAPEKPAAVEVIAHRGESHDAPENTMAAFQLAWDRGVKAIELDVHLTKDGALIVSHDADTERTTGTKKIIKQSTLTDLRTLDAGLWKGEKWKGEKLPTLDEALATIPKGARCFIEIKIGAESMPALVESVRKSGKSPEQLAIISFKDDSIAEAKRQMPHIQAYYLSSFRQDKETKVWTPTAEELIAKAKALGADGLDLAEKGPIDADFVRKVKAAGLGMYVWTVDDLDRARDFVKMGVDGITTNRAAWLESHLNSR